MLVTQSLNRVDDDTAKTYLMDVLNGVVVAQQNAAVQYLPASMKDVLVEGIDKALAVIADLAWDHYLMNDVPEGNDEVLRTVVEYHLFKGSAMV